MTQHRWTYRTVARAREQQAAGVSTAAIAESLGVSRKALQSALDRYAPGQGPGAGAGGGRPFTKDRARLYRFAMLERAKGLTWDEVAQAVGYAGKGDSLAQLVARYQRRVGFR